MRIGVLDWHWYNLPVEKRLQRISRLGFEGVQLAVTPTEMGFKLKNGTDAWFNPKYAPSTRSLTAADLKRMLRATGLVPVQLGPHYALGEQFSWLEASTGTFPSREARRERVADVKRMIDCAADLDCQYVEIFSGGSPKNPGHWPLMVDMVADFAQHAESRGVTLTFENMGGWQMLVNDENSLIRLVRDVGSKAVRVTFDPKNLTQTRYQADIPRAVRTLKGLVALNHAGDAIYGVGHVAPLGTGTVPFPEYLVALSETGFDGWLLIEAMDKESQYTTSKKYLEDIIRLLIRPKWS
jgi:sugar phosphate isomerase/epimerase